MSDDPRERLTGNPFYVLGLPADCPRADAERAAGKLLGLIALGVPTAVSYWSPLGQHVRTADAVRRAIAELRDPARRLLAEVWASAPQVAQRDAGDGHVVTRDEPGAPPGVTTWPDALEDLALRPASRSTR